MTSHGRRSVWVLAGVLAVACRASVAPSAPSGSAVDPQRRSIRSNVERKDYAGSAACEGCHSGLYAKWRDSPMRRMTRLADGAHIEAPFDGAVFRFKGESVTLVERDGRKYMKVESRIGGSQIFRVTRVIGGRVREDFVGREVTGLDENSAAIHDERDEPVLPLSWLIASKAWRYKGYSVMVKERPHFGAHGAPWRKTCIFCHNTVPYLSTIYDDLAGGGHGYQGSVSDGYLPEDRKWKAKIADRDLLSIAIRSEIAVLDRPTVRLESSPRKLEDLLVDVMQTSSQRFDESHLVEVGIGCEACHNGAREHVDDPARKPTFEPKSPVLTTLTPSPVRKGSPTRAEWINHTCARCHTVLFSRYPFTWEGGSRKQDPGGSTINSGEARDFLLGGCSAEMACTTCHDPHGEDSRARRAELGTVAGNKVCLPCHDKYKEGPALRAHTHHATNGVGSACLSCHMPRKNTGLASTLVRYHRIGSPTDKARVEKDRPLECALCHADKSVASLLANMESFWGKRYDSRAIESLYGNDLGQNVLSVTLLSGKPHEQIVAAGVIGERGRRGDAASVLLLLTHEYPQVRYYAREALERLYAQPLTIDLDADAATIKTQASAWFEKVQKK